MPSLPSRWQIFDPFASVGEDVFPTLRGLTYDTKKRPTFSTRRSDHVSGREVVSANQQFPRWEFSLTYEWLPDNREAGVSDLNTMMGFFLSQRGSFKSFLFADPSDKLVLNGAIGIGDATTTDFPVVRSKGGFVEPVGKADAATMVVRKNGTATTAYTLNPDAKGRAGRVIHFTTAPASGVAITADFGFWFRCRFMDDSQEYNEFMHRLWELQQCEFRSIL